MGTAPLDTACPELARLRALHRDQVRLLQGPRLGEALARRQEEDLRRHGASCRRCADLKTAAPPEPTSCPACGTRLSREGDRLVCRGPLHGLKAILRGRMPPPRALPAPRSPAAPPSSPASTPRATPGSAPRAAADVAPRRSPSGSAPRSAPGPARGVAARKGSAGPPPGPRARVAAPPPPRPPPAAPDPAEQACRVLGLPSDASAGAVRAAWREQAHFFHPDKAYHLPREAREAAEARMRDLNAAYDTLRRMGRA